MHIHVTSGMKQLKVMALYDGLQNGKTYTVPPHTLASYQFCSCGYPSSYPTNIGPSQQLLLLLHLYAFPRPCQSAGCCMHQNHHVRLTSVHSVNATKLPSSSHDLLGTVTSACRCTLFTTNCPYTFTL